MIIDKNSDSSVDLVDWLRRSSDESENLARTNMLSSARISDVYKLTGEKQVLDILYDEETGRLTIVYKDGSTVSIYLPTDGGGCDCDLSEYVKSSDLEAEISELESKIPISTSGLTNDSNFVNQTQVDERIKEVVGAAPEALDTLQELGAALGNDANFASTITNQIAEVKASIPSVEGLASETYVNEQISKIEIPSTEGLATKEEVSAVEAKIPSLDGYAKEEWVEGKGYLTEHQDISNLATKDEVAEQIAAIEHPTVDLTPYATKEEIKDAVNYQHFGEGRKTIQLANHDTISGIATDGTGHNLAMLSKWDVADFGAVGVHMNLNTKDSVTINDKDHVATEEWVAEQIGAIEHPTVDLSGLATKEEVKAVEDKIPSIEGLATEKYVDDKVAAIEHPQVDLTPYAKSEDVTKEIAESAEATKTWVGEQGYLTEHQDISDVVRYSNFSYNNEERKTIQLDNYDSISGVDTKGSGHNLVMLSKWDVADFGAPGIHANINTSSSSEMMNNEDGSNPYTDGMTIVNNDLEVVEHVPVVTVNDKFALATLNHVFAIREADAKSNAETYAKKSELPSVEGLAKEEWVEDKITILETKIPDADTLATKEEVEAKVDKASMATINGRSLINGGDITLDLTLYKVVESLPSTDIDVNKIYLVLSSASGVSDIYSEYIYVDGEWEKVGEYKATVDLTPYLKIEDANTTYASKHEVDAKIAGVLSALQWKDSVNTFADIAVVYPDPKEGDTVFVDDENTTYTFMDGEWIAVSANSIPQATEEYDGLMPASAMTEVKKISSIQGDVMSIDAKLSILESKISALSKTNIEVVAIDGSSATLSDTTKDYSIQGKVTSNFTVSGSKSVTISDTEISNDAKLNLKSTGEVELKGITTSGEFTKTGGNCIVNISEADSVVIKDMTILSSQYNGIEIGMGSVMPKSVIIDNCDFSGEFSNNAISIHGTQDDAIVNISNCKFSSVSNPLRLSNKGGGKLTINVTNCSCDKWEEGKYAGFLLCQDFTSTSVEEAAEKNLFGSDKVTINFINFTMPGGVKLTKPEDMASICGTADNSQIAYVYRNAEYKADTANYVITSYGDGSAYPKINII